MERHDDFLTIKLMLVIYCIYNINVLKNLFNRQSSENCLRMITVEILSPKHYWNSLRSVDYFSLDSLLHIYAFIIHVSRYENIREKYSDVINMAISFQYSS